MCNEYNGYKNYQTWNVALWIDNDESTYDLIADLIARCKDDYEAAEELKRFIEEANPLADTATMFSDILTSALSEVDYMEIIESHKEEE